ncbi:MAG: hypothetical protein J3R72DRAFT_445200, partial [Linnemannia gamsii]
MSLHRSIVIAVGIFFLLVWQNMYMERVRLHICFPSLYFQLMLFSSIVAAALLLFFLLVVSYGYEDERMELEGMDRGMRRI